MNHQPANSYPPSHPDARIDQVLDALRATEPPTGLEQRIAARLAQAAEARALSTSGFATTPRHFTTAQPGAASLFAVILNAVKDPRILLAPGTLYIAAGTVLTVVIAITIVHHHTSTNTAQTASDTGAPSRVPHLRDGIIVAKVGTTPSGATVISSLEGAARQPRQAAPGATSTLAAETISHPLPPSAQDQDLDEIARAETLAPSRSAPPMPLTAQEKLIQSATRPGQPIQLAELDIARAPILRAAAEARQTASLEHYVRSLLAPFAVADALQPTTDSQPQEVPTPAPPTSNPTN